MFNYNYNLIPIMLCFREELIKKIDDFIHTQNDNFEKQIEERHSELFTKNELQFKDILKNV